MRFTTCAEEILAAHKLSHWASQQSVLYFVTLLCYFTMLLLYFTTCAEDIPTAVDFPVEPHSGAHFATLFLYFTTVLYYLRGGNPGGRRFSCWALQSPWLYVFAKDRNSRHTLLSALREKFLFSSTMGLFIHMYINMYVYIQIYINIYVYVHTYMYIYVHVMLCVYIYLNICMYIVVGTHFWVHSRKDFRLLRRWVCI